VEVSLGRIRTYRDLQRVFHETNFNDKYIPSHKIIYVIEDIDCLDDIVKSRSGNVNQDFIDAEAFKAKLIADKTKQTTKTTEEEKEEKENTTKIIDKVKEELGDKAKAEFERFKEYQKMFNRDPLTLAHLLNIIDGILETPGRILIITSNHPEKLDEALIRPGRVDMKVEFGKSTVTDTINVLEMFYKQPFPIAEKHKIPNQKFTPAHIYNFCFQSQTIDEAILRLETQSRLLVNSSIATRSNNEENAVSTGMPRNNDLKFSAKIQSGATSNAEISKSAEISKTASISLRTSGHVEFSGKSPRR